ncbi:MAG: class I SAM-dependent methyltransferase [Crocinitomicaceae bacterium]|nr:class I SAM-dependent methyltransferase [Crocinitomicaceae bacterium]
MKGYESPALYSCKDCSFVFTKKIPEHKELIEHYSSNYAITRYFSPITAKRYSDLLDSFEPFRKTNRILDIGCGHGFFLEIAMQKGWEVYGSELTEASVKECSKKGIKMFHGELKDGPFENDFFDIIVSIEVIEHINSPQEFVDQIYKLLRKGGEFYMSTPNFNSTLRYRLKADYDVIEYPNHLSYYTHKTLTKLFLDHQFLVDKISTTGISITRLKTSKGKSNQEYVSETSDDEMLRYRIERNIFLRAGKSITNGILNLFKIGDSLKASFIKK